MSKKYVPTNKFKTFTATKVKAKTNSYKIELAWKNLDYKNPDAASTTGDSSKYTSDNYLYRVSGNKITCLKVDDHNFTSYNDYPKLDKSYYYYVLKGYVKSNNFESGQLPAEGKTITLKDAVKTKLNKYASKSQQITLPKPVVAKVSNLRFYVYKDNVTSRRIMWDAKSGGVTGFKITSYSPSGKVTKSVTKAMSAPTKMEDAYKVYVPYSSSKTAKTAYFTVKPYYKYNGKTYWGKESDKLGGKSVRLQPSQGDLTKINKNKAVLTIYKADGAVGTDIYQYKNGKWVCIKKGFTGKTYTVKGTNAGIRNYKFKSYLKDNGTYFRSDAFSKSYKPMDNVYGWGSPKRASAYKGASHFFKPEQLKSDNGKVTLKGFFVNTHIFDFSMTVKATVKVDGKKMGTATFSSGRIGAKSCSDSYTKKIKTGLTDKDLRQANVSVTYTIIKTKIY